MKLELIDNKKHFWKFSSVWLTSLGTALTAVFEIWPDAATQTWLFLPDSLKQVLPIWMPKAIAISVIIAGIASRLIKQPKLSKSNESNSENASS